VKVAVVTDEVSADLESALELAAQWNLRAVELRGVGEGRVPLVSPYWRRRIVDLVRAWELEVVALSPGLFKIPLPEPIPDAHRVLRWQDAEEVSRVARQEELLALHRGALLDQTIELAQQLGARLVVAFSFLKPHGASFAQCPDAVVALLREAAERVHRAGLQLALENEHVCWADTGQHAAELTHRVDHPALGINWDPANAFFAEETPYPDGYRAVASRVLHVHFKDAVRRPEGHVYAVEGEIDWPGQIRALARDGYGGHVSVETHCVPKIASAAAGLVRLRTLLAEAGVAGEVGAGVRRSDLR